MIANPCGMWTYDEPGKVPLGDQLYRRVLRRPLFFTQDLLTGAKAPLTGALQIDEDSGMSVYLDSQMRVTGCTSEELYDARCECLIRFAANVARECPDWGIVSDPVDDGPRGAAHGLVRNRNPRPSKSAKRTLRTAILNSYSWACSC